VDKKYNWTSEQLSLRVNLDKYKALMKFTKLGLNIFNRSVQPNKGPEIPIDGAVIYMARLSAILELELSSHLKESNPHVHIRVRDLDSSDVKTFTVRYKDYLKILEERLFEFPDIYMWPYNFDTIEEYESFQHQQLRNEQLVGL
jgi:hypothetical protein